MKIYVSVTSIFQKQHLFLQTLKSILKQSQLPDKCFIYLSENPYLLDKGFKNKELNKDLADFINSNDIFQIKWVDNIGPYRKLLYLLKEKWDENCLILTIDDDIQYHSLLIQSYIADYNKYKCCIAYRGFTPYFIKQDWSDFKYKKAQPVQRSLYNFANSGVGTVTHPSFFHKTKDLIFDLKLINELCKTTDDIWYYICRIANNIDTIIINKPGYLHFTLMPECALFFQYNNPTNTNTINTIRTAQHFIKHGLLN